MKTLEKTTLEDPITEQMFIDLGFKRTDETPETFPGIDKPFYFYSIHIGKMWIGTCDREGDDPWNCELYDSHSVTVAEFNTASQLTDFFALKGRFENVEQ